jgi:hypothetical protein
MQEFDRQRQLAKESEAAELAEQERQDKAAHDRLIEINAKISELSSDNLNKITDIFDRNDKNETLLELKTKLSEISNELKTKLSEISNEYNVIFRETVIPELIALVNENRIQLEALKKDKPEITLTSLDSLESNLKELSKGNVISWLAEEFNSDFLDKHLRSTLIRLKIKLQVPLNDELNKLTSIPPPVPAPKPKVQANYSTYSPEKPFYALGLDRFGGSSKSSKKRRKPIKKRRNTKRRN